eukprot:snap_masked-scaffold_1-processed-gene-15.35-mRNA-1 protein AED:1.00 eAED:1.00 QI:0/-1/0/0/-1/1/1/0/380
MFLLRIFQNQRREIALKHKQVSWSYHEDKLWISFIYTDMEATRSRQSYKNALKNKDKVKELILGYFIYGNFRMINTLFNTLPAFTNISKVKISLFDDIQPIFSLLKYMKEKGVNLNEVSFSALSVNGFEIDLIPKFLNLFPGTIIPEDTWHNKFRVQGFLTNTSLKNMKIMAKCLPGDKNKAVSVEKFSIGFKIGFDSLGLRENNLTQLNVDINSFNQNMLSGLIALTNSSALQYLKDIKFFTGKTRSWLSFPTAYVLLSIARNCENLHNFEVTINKNVPNLKEILKICFTDLPFIFKKRLRLPKLTGICDDVMNKVDHSEFTDDFNLEMYMDTREPRLFNLCAESRKWNPFSYLQFSCSFSPINLYYFRVTTKEIERED